jgi:2-polyprenyl-3-methyl-5-hydroxy-6-metoxy-1,4-benzoquinol methylase
MTQYEQLIWTPEMVKNFWDYESQFPEQYFTYKRSTEISRQISRFLQPGDQLLDYGCGPGYLVDKFMKADLKVAGLDFSEATIKSVNQSFKNNKSFLGAFKLEELLESNLKFDAVTVIEVVEHLYDEPLKELLNTIKSLLKPGGIAIFSTPNEEDLEKSMLLCPVTNQIYHRWQHVRSWSKESLGSYLTNYGFEIVNSFATNFSTSFQTDHSKHPIRDKWVALRRKTKDQLKPHRKQPHLVAIARYNNT